MNAYFFHTAAQPLFGIYAPPRARVARDQAVLLCAPVGHEYVRTHWALRQLADRLTHAGFHLFRFDYSGLGDSWGDFESASVEQWLADTRTALGELIDTSGVRDVTILGVRLGATLAVRALQEQPVRRLVLWDPVVQGRAFVE